MPSKMKMTTKAHFKIFKEECLKWIETFGLTNWEIKIIHEAKDEDLAWFAANFDAKAAGIFLNKKWDSKTFELNEYELRKCAFHEVCEVLLDPLRYLGECRFLSDSEMGTAVHEVIHRLENSFWEKQYRWDRD